LGGDGAIDAEQERQLAITKLRAFQSARVLVKKPCLVAIAATP
jgi:hypothetical protein